jgi:hypothetical protein
MAARPGNPHEHKKDRLFKDLTRLSTNHVDKLWKSMLMIFLIEWLSIPSANCPNNRQFLL